VSARGLRRASPLANAFLLLAEVGAALAWPRLVFSAATLSVIAALARASGIPLRGLVPGRRFVVVFALVLFVAQALSVRSGAVLVSEPFRVTTLGILSGAEMGLRFLLILAASALFVRTTDPDRLADGLVRLRVPYRYAYLVVLALRFVPFFEDELRAVRDAQRMRGLEVSVRGLRRALQTARLTFVPVIVSALHRVDTIAISMKGRCFGLHARRTSSREDARSAWSIVPVAVGLALVAGAVVGRIWGGSG